MKKIIWLFVMVCFLMAGCTNPGEVVEVTDMPSDTVLPDITQVPEITDLSEETEVPAETEAPKKPDRADVLALAYQGHLEGIEFGLGDLGADIATQWGKPEDEGYFIGGYYMNYGDLVFLTDGSTDDNNVVDYGVVKIISYSGTSSVFGISLGMTLDDVREIIGEPDAIEKHVESELYGENVTATYNTGDYDLVFLIENESAPINSIYLLYHN